MKKVTLCMPVYNAETTLREALDSVIAQTYPIEKIKIFNNASTDRSLEIIQEYASRYPSIEVNDSPVNVGLEGNLTKCILAADNDYCGIVHSDDVYEARFVEESIKALEKSPDCVASFTRALEIDSFGKVLNERFVPSELIKNSPPTINKEQFLPLILNYSNFITCPSVIVKSDVYREKVKFCNVEKYKSSADLEMWFRMIEFGKILFVPKVLMKYRISTASFSFRLAQTRTHRHDFFIVLDDYINRWPTSSEDRENYHFLNLKDQAFRNFKIFQNKKKNQPFVEDSTFDLGLVISRIFRSKWHFKIASSILVIQLLVYVLKMTGWSKVEKNISHRS